MKQWLSDIGQSSGRLWSLRTVKQVNWAQQTPGCHWSRSLGYSSRKEEPRALRTHTVEKKEILIWVVVMVEEGAAVSERASSGDLLRSVLEPWAEHLSAQTWEETHGKRITTKQGIEFPSFKTEKS